jgi:hypothetical protein
MTSAVSRVIAETGYLRRPRLLDPDAAQHKEWLHFCVLGDEAEVIVNYSLMGDLRAGAPRGAEAARLTILARAPLPSHAWEGDVEIVPPGAVRARAGRIDATFGDSRVAFEDGAFVVQAALSDRRVAADLRLRPVTLPLFRPNTFLGGAPIHWLVVARLLASGTVTLGDRTYRFEDAPAYHDHNWGKWRWGHDFSWSWGFGLPVEEEAPWSLVFTRLVNRGRTKDLGHALFLWKGEAQARIFQEGELTVRPSGYLQRDRVPKFPSVMGLVSPETSTDVPARFDLAAEAHGDAVRCGFEAEDVAQIIVPSETDLGLTIINEVSGRVSLDGRIAGERVAMEGRAFFEFLTAG